MPDFTTATDVQAIATAEATRSQKYLLGITKTAPRYERVPAPIEEDPNAIFEFVVDCWILESPTQAIVIGSTGLRTIENILVSGDATGDLLADIHVPVEIRKNSSGQLEVVGRAKVALPTLQLDEYTAADLGIAHILELEYDSVNSVWRDAFGIICDPRSGTPGPDGTVTISSSTSTTTALSNLNLLGYNDSGTTPGFFGTHMLQRTIVTTSTVIEVKSVEQVSSSEEYST